MVTRETERIDVSKKFSREFERKDRVKSEILSRILERGLGKAREMYEEDECLDGLKGMRVLKFM